MTRPQPHRTSIPHPPAGGLPVPGARASAAAQADRVPPAQALAGAARRPTWAVAGCVLTLAGALAGCGGEGGGGGQLDLTALEAAMPRLDQRRVETAVLAASEARLTLDIPGEISGSEDVLLASALGGLVERVEVELGDEVRKGQVLATIDREPRAAQVDQARAQLDLARAELGRTEKMGDLATPAQRDQLKAQVAMAEASLRLAESQLARTALRSPVDGVVASLGLDVGEIANPGQPAIRVVQLDPVKVSLSVSDRDVVALARGTPARVSTPARGAMHQGEISNVGAAADLSTRSFLVEVTVPNPDRELLPGMIASVAVDRVLAEGVVILPQSWIVTRGETYGVFVVEGGDTPVARWRAVELGQVVRDQVVVSAGVSPGDEVVAVGQHELVDGDAILVGRRGQCCTDGRAVW